MIYLLHFAQPISDKHTAQHYIGWTNDLDSRIREHRRGNGSRLCQVAAERRIKFVVAEVWAGNRQLERRLKNLKNAPKLCPICQQRKQP